MAINDYHFITEWHIPGTINEVFDVLLGDAASLMEWWPSTSQKPLWGLIGPSVRKTGFQNHSFSMQLERMCVSANTITDTCECLA